MKQKTSFSPLEGVNVVRLTLFQNHSVPREWQTLGLM